MEQDGCYPHYTDPPTEKQVGLPSGIVRISFSGRNFAVVAPGDTPGSSMPSAFFSEPASATARSCALLTGDASKGLMRRRQRDRINTVAGFSFRIWGRGKQGQPVVPLRMFPGPVHEVDCRTYGEAVIRTDCAKGVNGYAVQTFGENQSADQ